MSVKFLGTGSYVPENIVTNDEEGAKELINFLKQNSFGLMTDIYVSIIENNELIENDQSITFSFGVNYIQGNKNAKKIRMNFTNQTINSYFINSCICRF